LSRNTKGSENRKKEAKVRLSRLPARIGNIRKEGLHQLTTDLTRRCLQGRNDWGHTGYGGPCPPRGKHRYRHRVFALDTLLPPLKNPHKANIKKAMIGHIIARTELTGMYERLRG
jgi:Raf kinase inhibitor-like YbhB/YbcL family protein